MILTALLFVCAASSVGIAQQSSNPTYILTRSYETESHASDTSTSSSHGSDVFIERLIARHEDGIELEYDFEPSAPPEERVRNWQLPARIFKPVTGSTRLLNAGEVEARLEQWLNLGKIDRSACGRWIFTWNAFKIECDLQSVVATIDALDLNMIPLGPGVPYADPMAIAPEPLARTVAGSGAVTYTATLRIDPAAVLGQRAEEDRIVAELMGEQNNAEMREVMRSTRATKEISGDITVTFDTDPSGTIMRRTKVTKLLLTKLDGSTETSIAKQVVERRQLH
ncbi:hypothetical protein ACPVPU_00310 [Sphingomonas sp. CJ99]